MKRIAWLLALSAWLIVAGQVFADGIVIPDTARAKVNIPDQEALIHWADGVETMVIQTSFTGEGSEFAWVVPTPSKPEVTASTTGLFPTLRTLTAPELRNADYTIYIFFLVTAAVILGLAAGQPFKTLICLILFLLLVAMFASAYSTAGLTSGLAGVQIHEYKVIGDYEVVVLSSSKPSALTEWLAENGFHLSNQSETAIHQYVDEGWFLTAVRQTPEAAIDKTASTHPLAFRFPVTQPVYPMRLTATGSDALDIDLYVFGPQRAAADGFHTAYCNRVVYPAAASYEDWANPPELDELAILHPELRRHVEGSSCVTKLSASLRPTDMQRDVAVRWDGDAVYKPIVWTGSGARNIALNVAGICLSFTVMALPFIYRGRSWLKDARLRALRFMGLSMVGSLVVGLVVYAVIPKTSQEPRRIWRGQWDHMERSLDNVVSTYHKPADVTADIEQYRVKHGLQLTDEMQTFEEYVGTLGVYNVLEQDNIRREDSPGNITYEWTDNGLVITAYNQVGAPLRVEDSGEKPQP